MEGQRKRAQASAVASEPAAPLHANWILALVVFLVAAGAVYIYQRTVRLEEPPERRTAPPPLVVQREHLSTSYRAVAELRKPLILSGTVADQWMARHSFTPSFLAQRLSHVMAHRQEEKRCFMTFHDNKPLEPLINEKWEDFNVKVNVTLPEVLGWDRTESDLKSGPFLYFSEDIDILRSEFTDIGYYLYPLNDLILSLNDVQINLWIGRAGIITHTHYDCTFNFFVQLQGRKRFTLFPPDSPLYLYPCLHPHYGHSQVNVLSPNLTTFPESSRAVPWVADVKPGDMLVVPPFWFHHVETLEQSVSVNVWSDAPEYALVNQIYEQVIPFDKQWSWDDMVRATRIYIDMLLKSLDVDRPHLFIKEKLVNQRYKPVVSSGNLIVSESAMEKVQAFCSTVDWQKDASLLTSQLERGIHLLQPLFILIPTRATLEICVGNYIEHLIHLAIGLDYIYPFLKNCFN